MSREQSAIIKGIAILLMLIYHLNNIPGINGLDNEFYNTLSTASHPITFFLIVSGYGLYYLYRQGKITWKYLFRRTLKLYLAFWLVLLFFVVGLASWLYPGRFSISWDKLFVNLIGWRWDYCIFTWFLLPYILMTFSAKWCFRIIDYLGNVVSLLVAMFIYLFTSFLISRYFDSWLQWHYEVYHVILWAQTLLGMTMGAVMARLVLAGKSIIWKKLYGRDYLIMLLLVLSFVLRGQIHISVLNSFHAALVVWLVLHMSFKGIPKKVLIELGDKSMIMWLSQGFLGAVLFSEYYLLLRWPLLIWVVWVIVCYSFSCLLKPVVNGITRVMKLS